MPSPIDPLFRAYLQHRVQQWLAHPDRTARDLAKAAHVSPTQISDVRHRGTIGWTTMEGLLPVFGLTLETLRREAEKWAKKNPEAATAAPAKRSGPHRLAERDEWPAVSAAVGEQHSEIDAEDVAAVGRLVDEPDVFAGPLDVPTVAGIAGVLAARRLRLARRR